MSDKNAPALRETEEEPALRETQTIQETAIKESTATADDEKYESNARKIAPLNKKPRGFGTVNINASPWADVKIDGVDYTSTPILGLKLRAGRHKATFVNPEIGVTKTRTFVVKPDKTVRILVEME